MANKRIIDLTAAGGLALTDVLEIDTGTLSLRVTGQQVYNLILATLSAANPLVLAGGNVSIASNGNISVNGVTAAFISALGGNFSLQPNGSGYVSANLIQFLSNGTIITTNGAGGVVLTDSVSGNQFRLLVNNVGNLGTTPYP